MNNDNIINPEIISVGEYKILYTYEYAPNSNPKSRTDDWVYRDDLVKSVNNAEVKYLVDLKCTINWQEIGKSINSISFLMPRDEAKLGDIFLTSPYGLIKKNRTGVGATTLELNSPRNSIIVVPTKALAYNKAKNSKVKIKGKEKYRVQYVGGAITGFKTSNIEDYLSDPDIIHKKFLVVADSLPKLLEAIGEENYKDYFFMVDEIDSYQYDGNYRPALEKVIDYYFKFPSTKRCLVSATVGEFSNSKIEEEPIINVAFNQPKPRTITLLHTNNVIATTVKQIQATIAQCPDEKILIAYNLVKRGIIPIIENLDETLRKECAILCSTTSKAYAGDYYTEIIGEKLSNKITFMTCTYFVGVDISEGFHLISISDSDYSHTLLSEDKLEQIAGRCRDTAGLLSETIIYKSRNKIDKKQFTEKSLHNLKKKIIKDSLLLADFTNTIPLLKNTYPELNENWLSRLNMDAIIENSLKSYYNTQRVRLIRQDIDDIFRPAYFNIDNLLIQFKLLNTLYRSKENLLQSLMNSCNNIVDFQELTEVEERISKEIQELINERNIRVEQDEIENIILQFKNIDSLEGSNTLAKGLKMTSTDNGKTFIDRFLELQAYLPFDKLTLMLPQYKTKHKYDKFYNSVIFWTLSDNHHLKGMIRERLPLNTPMIGDQIREILNSILMSVWGFKEIKTNKEAFGYLDIFCKKSNRKKSRNKELENYYIIESYDVNNFNIEPLKIIEANIDVKELFRFPKDVLTK